MTKQPIEKLAEDAKPLDLVELELPASIMTCVSHGGMDYTSGYFIEIRDNRIVLAQFQKAAYGDSEPSPIPLDDITSYEILRRYKPVPGDEIDYILAETLDIPIEE
jgi:hypothetical protein|tara:strand:- start:633 stop:950 length:318 start_codon:yes stop_codon:yes gene_type:complete